MRNQRDQPRFTGLLPALIGGLLCTATLLLGPARHASAQAVAPSWRYTANLNKTRAGHTATLLPDGKVLVTGGFSFDPSFAPLNSAELYDPATEAWSSTGNLSSARGNHTATLLPNGKVLVAGGADNTCCSAFNSAELYDPATGTWSSTGNLNTTRTEHTATLLSNGKVLVAGGLNFDSDYNSSGLNSAELYDPVTGTWSSTGNLNDARGDHTATLLPNGKVLVVGGGPSADSPLISAELYDPVTGTWGSLASLNTARLAHTATLLPNGKVLVAGGRNYDVNPDGGVLNSAELYDWVTDTWRSTASLNTARLAHRATLLPNGKVLVVGGRNFSFDPITLNGAELYDSVTGSWSITADLNTGRISTATLLLNGKVLVAGGLDDSDFLNTAELYDPGTNSISNPIDDAQTFVRQQYRDFLNRERDADGLSYWTSQITQCGSDTRCVHDRRIGVSAAFFIEQEFQDSGYYVDRFYQASFGRQPNYSEFTADRSRVIGGSNLEANKQAFADEWVQRQSFRDAYPNTMSNMEVVNKLFDSAGLTSSLYDPLRQQEILAMNAGRSRALVLRDVIEVPDFKNVADPNDPRYSEIKQTSQYNPAFVLMQYFGYLRRDPDQGGYGFWLNVLNNGEPNNYRGMVCAFITSTEYQLRFGSLVTRSNADCSR
jgi:N-acetylneuraminic acid mutarotase